MKRIPLAIDSLIPQVLESLSRQRNLVLQATPGSGKTTRVPPALLSASFTPKESEILVLEPRRLAAKYSARRVAEEMGEDVGQTVGYQFRFENKTGPHTRLKFLTEGMLMRRLLRDPLLKNVSVVVLDEFHERHLHTDIALSFLAHLQKTTRTDLRLIVMSATLNTEEVAKFLEPASILQLETRQYPIEQTYLSGSSEKPLDALVKEAVQREFSTGAPEGDTLVFLPGMAEIRRAESALQPLASRFGFLIFPLHGELDREEQDRAIQRQSKRKVILSTNVAETSLTIEGVNLIIDSGLERSASYSWWSGVPVLRTRSISRASATQRAGRAGRTGPGKCVRLYSKNDHDGRASFQTPEIVRADITQTVLELKTLGIQNTAEFHWFQPPPPQAVEAAETLLFHLGATSSIAGSVTSLGKRLVEIPAHPRIARMLVEAEERGVLAKAARLAAGILEGDLESLDALEETQNPASHSVRRTENHLLSGFKSKGETSDWRTALAQSVLRGFPDRVAERKEDPGNRRLREGQVELLLSSGGVAQVNQNAFILAHRLFIALDVQEMQRQGGTASRLFARSLVPIEDAWLLDLEPSMMKEDEAITWDETRRRVLSRYQLRYGQIVLEEKDSTAKDTRQAALVLFREATGLNLAAIESWHKWVDGLARLTNREVAETLLGRCLLALKAKRLEIPSPQDLGNRFLQWGWETFSLEYLKSQDWPSLIPGFFSPSLSGEIDRLAPSSLLLPSGRRATVNYPLDKEPWVESRLQDFFGWMQAPTILNGAVPLTLHLLAPNYRPVQVTQDLAGFWKRHYPDIRKELSRRYPRHAWPEDPSKPVPQKPRK